MAGYSYFNYDQMTLLEVEVHSDELELLKQAADEYDWKSIRAEVEPRFKDAALDFRDKKRQSACPHKKQEEVSLQETFPFWDEVDETDKVSSGNPKGAGRKGQDFISYLKAFELAPVLRVEQNSEAIAGSIAGNPAFYVACEFTCHPAARTLRDFDHCSYRPRVGVQQFHIGRICCTNLAPPFGTLSIFTSFDEYQRFLDLLFHFPPPEIQGIKRATHWLSSIFRVAVK